MGETFLTREFHANSKRIFAMHVECHEQAVVQWCSGAVRLNALYYSSAPMLVTEKDQYSPLTGGYYS